MPASPTFIVGGAWANANVPDEFQNAAVVMCRLAVKLAKGASA